MKRCPQCNRIYPENDLNFCLDDGELLAYHDGEEPTRSLRDDSPPTIMMDSPRVTNPVGWPQNQSVQSWQASPAYQPQTAQYPMVLSPSQTLAIVSLGLGVGSITIGWCCYIGMFLSPAAMITGFIALVQIKNDPNAYAGKGLAIGGIAAAVLYFAAFILIMLIYGLATLGGALR